ncbi:MAG TPA: hypothetical protein VMZ91_10950 [Candidatus Paceibacterota bacterium]|nr:hypothetical protein [Candidatus Paceibacterota bacterium]
MKKQLILLAIILFIPLIFAETEIYPVNKDIELKFICTSNGEIPSATATFNITVSYPNGTTFIDNKQSTAKGNGAFNYTTYFPILGNYPVQMFCFDGSDSYSNSGNYEITTTGQKVSLSNIIIVLAFLVVGIILFILGYTFDREKWILKTSFYVFSLLMCLLAINSGSIIASESLGISNMSLAGLILIITVISFMILYLFITWMIQTFKQIKNKEGIRWNY